MTGELRWILLVAGVVLIAGVYLWGLRTRKRSASPEHAQPARPEPPPTKRAASTAHRVEPGLQPSVEPEAQARPASARETLPVVEVERDDVVVRRSAPVGRREPRIETEAPSAPSAPAATAGQRASPSAGQPRPSAPALEAPQKIIALRIAAPAETPFEGGLLREAIAAAGLEFGRYKVFHRLHGDGQPVFSLASLKEPGTFDPATMDGLSYRGVAMFSVLPGPVEPSQALDQLLQAARTIAERLGGTLQDERGAPLSMARIDQLRAEVAAVGRSRPAAPGR